MAEKRSEPKCDCGKPMTREDAEFWGECTTCRKVLPIASAQGGDAGKSQGRADREYHGGMGGRGEW